MRYEMIRIVAALALALLVSGCLGDAGDAPAPAGGPEGEALGVPPNDGASDDLPVPAASREPFHHQGRTYVGVCPWVILVGACTPDPTDDSIVAIEFSGVPASVQANVTWEAETALARVFYAILLVRENDAWFFRDGFPSERGESPLVVDWDVWRFADDEIAIGVRTGASVGAAGFTVLASPPQSFTIEGVTVSLRES